MTFNVEIRVKLKPGILDSEGKNVQKSLDLLGIDVENVTSVKTYQLAVDKSTPEEAVQVAQEACRRLLANPVVHDYSIAVV